MLTREIIEKYFVAEKQESIVFVVIGVLAIIAAIACWWLVRQDWSRGMAWPLLIVACIQITVGWTVYSKSDKQRVDNVYAFDLRPMDLKEKEFPRMEVVVRNFVIYRWVEIALLLSGGTLVFIFSGNAEQAFWWGLGLGLAIQSALMLLADYFAEKRALVYFQGLQEFTARFQ